jgi:hypothetical protein
MILDRIISKLLDIVKAVARAPDEIRERFEERRSVALAEELDKLAATKPYKNWRGSSQDLAYVLGEDGSPAGRAELWESLGLGLKQTYKRTAAQNLMLHAKLLERAGTHGIPWPEGE